MLLPLPRKTYFRSRSRLRRMSSICRATNPLTSRRKFPRSSSRTSTNTTEVSSWTFSTWFSLDSDSRQIKRRPTRSFVSRTLHQLERRRGYQLKIAASAVANCAGFRTWSLSLKLLLVFRSLCPLLTWRQVQIGVGVDHDVIQRHRGRTTDSILLLYTV